MNVIRIHQKGRNDEAFEVEVLFDEEQVGDTVLVRNPFADAEEQELEWYFERHLEHPYMDTVRARKAGESIKQYGESLFSQVFADAEALGLWIQLRGTLAETRIEVVGSPEFHSLHWEAIRDPKLPNPIADQAVIVRRDTTRPVVSATAASSPTVNILVVTARPMGRKDVSYRTISRPLVDALGNAKVRARIDIVRPGTYEAFLKHLDAKREEPEAERYHVVHFDLHGGLMTYAEVQKGLEEGGVFFQSSYAHPDITSYNDEKAFLFFAGSEPGKSDPVEAVQLASQLTKHQIPIVILNACQSGKQVGAQETSLGSHLMSAGAQLVVAMGYSVTVTAATIAMKELYEKLLSGTTLSSAIRSARRELIRVKNRKAYFSMTVELEDWILPVVYERQEACLRPREFTREEEEAFWQADANRYSVAAPTYGFFGRDLDILQIENRLLKSADSNLILIRGMGGAGKTTLLKHLGEWWQRTGFVREVFYFGYDEKAHNRQQIMRTIAQRLFDKYKFVTFESASPGAQQRMIADQLRSTRHLLILDNLESITGERLAIQNTLPPEEQKHFHSFLAVLRGGKSVVLLGSRSDEAWLKAGTFAENIYDLSGLDPEAASMLAEKILKTRNATEFRDDKDFQRLLKLLAGFPLALEVVLANLPSKTPTEILEALQAGGLDLDNGDAKDKTKSILACIDYSHSNLSKDAQDLLLCLAPFTGVFNTMFIDEYTEALQAQSSLVNLPFDKWENILSETENMGLISRHNDYPDMFQLQPTLSYFLLLRLNNDANAEYKKAIELAFHDHYVKIAPDINFLINSNNPTEVEDGSVLIESEFENLTKALHQSVTLLTNILSIYALFSSYFRITKNSTQSIKYAKRLQSELEKHSQIETKEWPYLLIVAFDDEANYFLQLNQFDRANSIYLEALDLLKFRSGLDETTIRNFSALILHNLGIISEAKRHWTEANDYYQQALQINIEFNNSNEQGNNLLQLGSVARKQQDWMQAKAYYQKALQIKIASNDRRSIASVLHNIGGMALEQRYWSEAKDYFQQSLQIRQEFNDRYNQGDTLHDLGVIAREEQNWEEAKDYYQKALQIKIEFNDRHNQAKTLHELGRMSRMLQQWEESKAYSNQALQIEIEFNDRHTQAATYHELGTVARQQQKWIEADEYYQQALRIFLEFDDKHSYACTQGQLGVMYLESQYYSKSLSYLLQALTVQQEFEDHYRTELLLRNLAQLWRKSGNETVISETANILKQDVDKIHFCLLLYAQ